MPVVVVVVVVLVVPECEGEVEAEVEVEVELDEEDDVEDDEVDDEEEDEELGGLIVVVVVVVVVVDEDEDEEVAGVEQVIVSETAPATFSGGMTPGVAWTATLVVPPPTIVTVTVHSSAEAIGMAARPRTTKIAAASSSTARSRRLNVKLVRPLLPPSTCASHASKFAAPGRPGARY